MRTPFLIAVAFVGAATAWAQNAPPPVTPAPGATPVSATAPNPAPLMMEEIEALVSPVALYPDALLAQVLIASTYPLEVAMAAQWVMQNPNLMGEQLNMALASQTWD